MPFMKRRFRSYRGRHWSWWRAYADRWRRRAVETTLWTPAVEGDALTWWYNTRDADSLTLATGAASAFASQVQGLSLTQATAALRPAYSATGWDGTLPCLTFDGAATNGDLMSGAAGHFNTVQSIFLAVERGTQNNDATGSLRPIITTALGDGATGPRISITMLRPGVDAGQTILRLQSAGTGSVAADAPDPFANGQKAVLFAQIKDNDLRCSINDGDLSDAGDIGNTTQTTFVLGGASGVSVAGMKFGEGFAIRRELTAAEISVCANYLAANWGIA